MSDLIDFDSPSTSNVGLLLASPLIPSPEATSNGSNINEAGPQFYESGKRHSLENNPFDMVMNRVIQYEINKEDPFEKVIEKAMTFNNRLSISKDGSISRRSRHSDILKMNKTMDETETNLDLSMNKKRNVLVQGDNDLSIITDLNNTNLIGDNVSGQVVGIRNSDIKIVPEVKLSMAASCNDLSILNNSAMNDSLLDHDFKSSNEVNDLRADFTVRPRSMSQSNFISPLSPQTKNRRSLSVTDMMKNSSGFKDNNTLNSVQSSMFEDPLNNAFRRTCLGNNSNSISNYSSNQFDLFLNKQKSERLNSDSSVFSGLSNISAIQTDSLIKMKNERLCSEGSVFSGISNLSLISSNNNSSVNQSSGDSSVFTNNTVNKGFIASRLQLSSTGSNTTAQAPLKSIDNSDLLKKFFEIKTRMSTSQIERPKCEDVKKSLNEESNSSLKLNSIRKTDYLSKSEEKLIDVDNSSNVVVNQKGVNEIIVHEAIALAEMFENMATAKECTSSEDDLLLSKTQMTFDDLPPSDEENVDNLIELPPSPLKESPKESKPTNGIQAEPRILSPKENIQALENEFVERKDPDKKAAATTLFLDLQKLIEEDNNPNAYKVLNDLQKLLGVECDNNTEILQMCLQNSNNFKNNQKSEDQLVMIKNIPDDNHELKESNKSELNETENISSSSKDVKESEEFSSDNNISDLSNKSRETNDKEVESENESQNIKESIERNEKSEESSENKKLAINLLHTLNKIVNEKNEDSAVNILRSLSTVLNMATELRTKNKETQNSELKEHESNSTKTKRLNVSTNSIHKSPSPKSLIANSKNKSFEITPLRKSMTLNSSHTNNNNMLDVPYAKDKTKSHLLNIKKRFPSDSGFTNSITEKKKSPGKLDKQSSSLTTNKTATELVTSRFKKKINSEIVTKKGPLKAVIPLGNMQKRGSISQKLSNCNETVTPPKITVSTLTSNIVSSTPNANGDCKNTKSKPKASSTPNGEGLRPQFPKTPTQQNTKNTLTYNISPGLLNSSVKGRISSTRRSTTRMERTMSPQKMPSTPMNNSENSVDSRLPRYSPRPVRVRNYSMNDLKTAKTPQKSSSAPKIASEKKHHQRHSVLSPLKSSNKLTSKGQPISLVSRLGKSKNIQTGPEKENYA